LDILLSKNRIMPSEEIGRLAMRTAMFPLAEYVDGKLTHTGVMKPRLPVTDYLQRQGRFAHLFTSNRNYRVIAEIQNRVDMYWREHEVV
jgi:pyruvate ferredoxin oxidoreductase beta subunit